MSDLEMGHLESGRSSWTASVSVTMSGLSSHLCWAVLQLQNHKKESVADSAPAATAFSNTEWKYLRLFSQLWKLCKLLAVKLGYVEKGKGKSGDHPLCPYLRTSSIDSWCTALKISSSMYIHTFMLLNGSLTFQRLWHLFSVDNLCITCLAALMIYIDRQVDKIETQLRVKALSMSVKEF